MPKMEIPEKVLSHDITQNRSRLPGLDVLRGVAIALVLVRHSWPEQFGGAGVVGVVVFFTLSGYLITGMLLGDIARHGKVRYARFYVHRAFRLLPALFAMLAVFAFTEFSFNVNGDRHIVLQSIFAASFYLLDLPLPFDTSVAVNHLWTLAIEEQFYLVWPILLVVFIRRKALLRYIVFVFVFLALLCVSSVVAAGDNPARLYILPTTWASTMVLGAWSYVYGDRIRGIIRSSRLTKFGAPVSAGFILVVIALWPEAKDSSVLYAAGGPLIAVATIALLFTLGSWRRLPSPLLEPVRLLGLISYATYLWNPLVLSWVNAAPGVPSWTAIPATIAVAVASWFSVEAWGRRARRHFDSKAKRTLGAK